MNSFSSVKTPIEVIVLMATLYIVHVVTWNKRNKFSKRRDANSSEMVLRKLYGT